MRSYSVTAWNEALQPLDQPTPVPAGTEVLLRVTAAGVCHSDLHVCEGHYDLGGGKRLRMADRGVTLPLAMGHEIAGTVVAVGPDAGDAPAPGSAQLVYPWIGCGICAFCARGEEPYCPRPRFLGIFRDGGYATHVLVPHPRYLLETGDLPPEVAAPYACSGLTTYSALRKIDAAILREEPVVLVGAGGLGLMCLTLLGAIGARGAIVLDIDADKRAAAVKLGALDAIDAADPDAVAQVLSLTPNGGGTRAVIDFVGSPDTVRLGLGCLVKGGKLVLVGLIGGEITLSLPLIPSRATTIQGSYVGTLTELRELMELVRGGRIPQMPTTCHPLEEADAVLGALRAGRVVGRAVLVP